MIPRVLRDAESVRIGDALSVKSRNKWRRWLAKHHKDTKEVWLVFYKKSSGKLTITYDEAVEEALCYGWIDVQTKRIDEERYGLRFTPRQRGSKWSRYNKARGLKMLLAGRMTKAGKALLPNDVLKHERDRIGT